MREKSNLNFKRILSVVLSIITIILIFAFFDYLVHQLSAEYFVPDYYFTNKIIYGCLWGFVFYFLLRKLKTNIVFKSAVFSALISIVLQVRYFYEGYSMKFVIEFLFYHFFILWVVSYLTFRLLDKVFIHT